MVAAVLAILAALATGFYTLMLMQTKSAVRYADTVRAEMLSRAGIDYAIAKLQAQAFKKTEDPTDPWYMWDWLDGAKRYISYPDSPLLHDGMDQDSDGETDNAEEARTDTQKLRGFSMALSNSANADTTTEGGSDRFSLNIFDAASRINVNAGDNVAVTLDNLCRVIGPPLVAADQGKIIPRVWEWYVADGAYKFNDDPQTTPKLDWPKSGTPGSIYGIVPRNIYYWLYDAGGTVVWDGVNTALTGQGRPRVDSTTGQAVYGDGYAIAGYRARHGRFDSLEQVKRALTYIERSTPLNNTPDDPLEQLEIEVKFAALRDYITTDSWVDTTSVCTGKFEWVFRSGGSDSDPYDMAIDRDKSWVVDDLAGDPDNKRGSLRGCYVTIINGHGTGQLRRIRTNGVDWIQLDTFKDAKGTRRGFMVPPGPTSSYMIIAPDNAALVDINGKDLPYSYPDNPPPPDQPVSKWCFPKTDVNGNLVPALYTSGPLQGSPKIDYEARPLCIHRAPVNINTASDKVLAALFLGINVTHGNYLSVGTDADLSKLAKYDPKATLAPRLKSRWDWQKTDTDWKINDFNDPNKVPYRTVEPYILTPKGLKRIPADSGRLTLDRPLPWPNTPADNAQFGYINNCGGLGDPNFVIVKNSTTSEAHELAYRIIVARQKDPRNPALKYINPKTGQPLATGTPAYLRGPFRCWDDFYFRVVKPWDDQRIDPASPLYDAKKGSVARLIMAHFNSNADILKFNPNIEWIDRWGRNFTELEPVMVYTNQPENNDGGESGHGAFNGDNYNPFDTASPLFVKTCDMDQMMKPEALPIFDRERVGWQPGNSLDYAFGPFGTKPINMGSYIIRSYRWKADEMIDKTDLNRSTTEFCFDSRGIYEIQSTGQVMRRGELLAERKISALVKVYDIWSESLQRQFVQGHITRARGARGTAQSGQVARDDTDDYKKNPGGDFRLALVTLPEPLVPLSYRIKNSKNLEIVDTTLGDANKKRTAWGTEVKDPLGGRPVEVPDVIANKVQPAGYDGQICLATNTLRFDPSDGGDADTFLASFNGDLDTETCNGNGREQAKTPANCQIRVVDTIGLLGALNDVEIDTDPGLAGNTALQTAATADLPPFSGKPVEIWRQKVAVSALRGLDPQFYWNNVICRQGKLRTDGAFVGGPGVAGNDGVLKYLCMDDDPSNYDNQNHCLNGRGAKRAVGEDFGNFGSSGDQQGFLFSTWAKTAWHHDDGRGHEFFDCSLPGWSDGGIRCEAWYMRKQGRVQAAICESGGAGSAAGQSSFEDGTWGVSGAGDRANDFSLVLEPVQNAGDWSEPDWPTYLFGGTTGVPVSRRDPNDPNYRPESPAYRIQPFRWQFLGARIFLQTNWAGCVNDVGGGFNMGGASKSGMWKPGGGGWKDYNAIWTTQNLFRVFVDSERWPDGPNYNSSAKYWCVVQPQGATGFIPYQDKGRIAGTGRAGGTEGRGDGGETVRYLWASPGGTATNAGELKRHTVFGMNNCNPGRGYDGCGGEFCAIYKNAPDDGTYAVLDEYKLSRKETVLRNPPERSADRITRDDANKPGEMTLSRYYLPLNPADARQCPTFTSQTMLQSVKGYDKKTTATPQYVTLARVTWNVFTPRFMHEYKVANGGTRPKFTWAETITKDGSTSNPGSTNFVGGGDSPSNIVPFRGPFDYCKYNDIKVVAQQGEKPEDYNDPKYDSDPNVMPYRCNRPTAADYQKIATYRTAQDYHATRGVEIELVQLAGNKAVLGTEPALAGKTFTNPLIENKILDASGGRIRIATDSLRYRVRFRYPVDRLADPYASQDTVDPAAQFLLDTPVFDDISITYFTKPRILDYKEMLE
ncbi:MAG: hypothetical protein NTW87_08650 [Planctomycetota bacterium]|nr:hypothetical protein [Planctomycetota bacterium]